MRLVLGLIEAGEMLLCWIEVWLENSGDGFFS